MQQPPYSPDLAAVGFLSVSSTEIRSEGIALFNAIDIIKNTTEELKRLSQNIYQQCFQHLYSRCQ
jgi:hypothetical protein